jgi:hypothetical protein
LPSVPPSVRLDHDVPGRTAHTPQRRRPGLNRNAGPVGGVHLQAGAAEAQRAPRLERAASFARTLAMYMGDVEAEPVGDAFARLQASRYDAEEWRSTSRRVAEAS